jgi:hypothetical protein
MDRIENKKKIRGDIRKHRNEGDLISFVTQIMGGHTERLTDSNVSHKPKKFGGEDTQRSGQTQIDRHRDSKVISQASFLFFNNKKSEININVNNFHVGKQCRICIRMKYLF